MTEESAHRKDADEREPSLSVSSDEDATESANGPEQRGEAGDDENLRQLADDNWNRYLRAVAEMDNLRKRASRDIENARKFGAERLASALLPVRDSLEAGLKAAAEADTETLDVASLLEGDQATLRLLDQALEAAGVTEIDPHGEPFDPALHEAMSMLPSATAEPGSVIEVIQKGYALNERVMRPARVIVARAPADDE
jgi:molecular chaperone GrpE